VNLDYIIFNFKKGTNTGVMRLVGEAVADEFHTCNLTVLGIATWGKIAFRDQMVVNRFFLMAMNENIKKYRLIYLKSKIEKIKKHISI